MSTELPILHPETQRLAEENALIREELVRLLAEADNLERIARPNLLALYQTKLGTWELRALEAQCRLARLKRRIELVQASFNRGEPPDLAVIEGTLEREFLDWRRKIEEAAKRVQAAESRLKQLLPSAEDRELKKLYYALAKKLHPDVNPGLTDDQRQLWTRAQVAYAAGDLAELRALALLAEKSGEAPSAPKAWEQLRQDQKTLRDQITALLKQIGQIESQPPFTLRRQLADESWLAARRAELERQIETLHWQHDALQAHWETLLTRNGGELGTRFGDN